MIYRFAAVALLACVVAGCTDADWDHALSYAGLSDNPQPAAQPAATAAVPADAASGPVPTMDNWCTESAKAAAREAREYGFDEATQRRRAEQALKQCQARH